MSMAADTSSAYINFGLLMRQALALSPLFVLGTVTISTVTLVTQVSELISFLP